jgi:hypothetical protein
MKAIVYTHYGPPILFNSKKSNNLLPGTMKSWYTSMRHLSMQLTGVC